MMRLNDVLRLAGTVSTRQCLQFLFTSWTLSVFRINEDVRSSNLIHILIRPIWLVITMVNCSIA